MRNVKQNAYEIWTKPNPRWVMVNCDEAFKSNKNRKNDESTGIGIIIRNEEGLVIAWASKRVNVKPCLEAEAEAIREGVVIVERCGFQKILLETDSEIMYK